MTHAWECSGTEPADCAGANCGGPRFCGSRAVVSPRVTACTRSTIWRTGRTVQPRLLRFRIAEQIQVLRVHQTSSRIQSIASKQRFAHGPLVVLHERELPIMALCEIRSPSTLDSRAPPLCT